MTNEKKQVTALKTRVARGIRFQGALEECVKLLPEAIALLYTPQWCGFAQFDEHGRLIAADGRTAQRFADKPDEFISSIFEARVFSEQAELRWLNDNAGKGRAVVLSDDGEDLVLDDYLREASRPGESPKLNQLIKGRQQTYLLWGEGVVVLPTEGLQPGWSRLTTPRIGRFHIPLAGVTSGRVHLIAQEYLAEVDNHGNVAVVDERLIGLKQA